ncbi:MAG: 50S ribosomal protein L3 [Patescibacteria group bacterium]|nr:50S ribosomal protein L3 [Patescibacteria group bacterium]
MSAILGYKKDMTQIFDSKGRVVPCTVVDVSGVYVIGKKTQEKDGYEALILGIGKKRNPKKTESIRGIKDVPLKRYEFRPERTRDMNLDDYNVGDAVKIDMFKEGDMVQVTGDSKGRGFQGVVKRYRFHGGPRTHGQSDRERAPGSIGAGTDPGRVFKGKKMPGRFGGAKTTLKNIEIVKVEPGKSLLCLKGSIPGARNGLLKIYKRR